MHAGDRLSNFVVGLSNVSPSVKSPKLGADNVCGQYPGAAENGKVLYVKCAPNRPPARYVSIMTSMPNMNFCELDVYGNVPGTVVLVYVHRLADRRD